MNTAVVLTLMLGGLTAEPDVRCSRLQARCRCERTLRVDTPSCREPEAAWLAA